MAILLMEGFDWLASSNCFVSGADNGSGWDANNSSTVDRGIGRGGIGYAVDITSSTGYLQKSFAPTASGVVGAAVYIANLSTSNELLEMSSALKYEFGLRANTDGSISVVRSISGDRGSSVGIGATSAPGVVTANTWFYLEMKFTASNTVGSVELKINSEQVLNATGLDNVYLSDSIRAITLHALSTGTLLWDDIYVLDLTGSRNNDFLGPVRIATLSPSGAGASAAWTPSAGANYAAVDELDPDDDTTYVESKTSGNTDRYAHEDLPVNADIVHAVSVHACARLTEAGSLPLKLLAYDGTTEGESASKFPAFDAAYQWEDAIFEDHPSGAAAWTVSEVNSGEFGFKVA